MPRLRVAQKLYRQAIHFGLAAHAVASTNSNAQARPPVDAHGEHDLPELNTLLNATPHSAHKNFKLSIRSKPFQLPSITAIDHLFGLEVNAQHLDCGDFRAPDVSRSAIALHEAKRGLPPTVTTDGNSATGGVVTRSQRGVLELEDWVPKPKSSVTLRSELAKPQGRTFALVAYPRQMSLMSTRRQAGTRRRMPP